MKAERASVSRLQKLGSTVKALGAWRRLSAPNFQRFFYYQILQKKGLSSSKGIKNEYFKAVPIWRKSATYLIVLLLGLAVTVSQYIHLNIQTYSPIGLIHVFDPAFPLIGTLLGLYSIKPRMFGEVGVPDCYRDELPTCAVYGREGILDISYWELFFLTNVSVLATILVYSPSVATFFLFLFVGWVFGLLLFFRERRRGHRCRICLGAQFFMGLEVAYFALRLDVSATADIVIQTGLFYLLFLCGFAITLQAIKVVVVVVTLPDLLTTGLSIESIIDNGVRVPPEQLDTDLLNYKCEGTPLKPEVIFVISLSSKKSLLTLRFLSSVPGRLLLSKFRVAIRLLNDRRLIISPDDLGRWDALQHLAFDPDVIHEHYIAISQSVMSPRRLSQLGSTNLISDRAGDVWAKRCNQMDYPYLVFNGSVLTVQGDEIDNAFLTMASLLMLTRQAENSPEKSEPLL